MGPEYLVIALGALGILASGWLSIHFARWTAARKLEPASVRLTELEARLQPPGSPLKVSVFADSGPGKYGTRIVIEGVCERLTLRRELPPPPRDAHALAEAPYEGTPVPPAPELETGDFRFDDTFFVLGPPALVHAILDADTRQLLRELTSTQEPGAVVLSRGMLQIEVPVSATVHAATVERRGREALALAQRLMTPADVPARLAENALHDPVPSVRLLNLTALVRTDPAAATTRATLLAAAGDGDAAVRLRAGTSLGADGRDALISVAADGTADDGSVETAVQGLGAGIPVDLADRVLRRSVGRRAAPQRLRSARACVAALALRGDDAAVALLRELLLASEPLAADTARALGRVAGPRAEAALIDGLDARATENRLEAARVLGTIGTAAAVAPLRDAERKGGALRRAAHQAVAEIQSRLTGAPGEVSLAGGEAGQVSMVEDPSGRVSLPDRGSARGES